MDCVNGVTLFSEFHCTDLIQNCFRIVLGIIIICVALP